MAVGFAERWLDPPASLVEPEIRRRSRLLSGVLLTLAGVGVVGSTVLPPLLNPEYAFLSTGSTWAGLAASLGLVVPYALNRRGRYSVAAALAVGFASLGVWGAILGDATGASMPAAVQFMIVPLLLATLFLPARLALVACGVNVAGLLAVGMVVPAGDREALASNIIYVVLVSSLLAAATVVQHLDLRQMESQRRRAFMDEKLLALGRVASGVAHEINNPLAFTRSNAEIMRAAAADAVARGNLPADVRADLAAVVESGDVTLRGLDRIALVTRSLERVASGNGAPARAHDLTETAENALAAVSARATSRVRFERDYRAARRALAAAEEVAGVALTLVANAVDAVERAGGGVVTARTFDAGDLVVLEVQDTGAGIDPADRARIFDPFFTTKPTGTGLGLSIAHRVATEHGGRLTFETETGRGTTFRLELPSARAPEASG